MSDNDDLTGKPHTDSVESLLARADTRLLAQLRHQPWTEFETDELIVDLLAALREREAELETARARMAELEAAIQSMSKRDGQLRGTDGGNRQFRTWARAVIERALLASVSDAPTEAPEETD